MAPYSDDAILLLVGGELSQAAQEELIGCAVRLSRLHHLTAQLHHLIGQSTGEHQVSSVYSHSIYEERANENESDMTQRVHTLQQHVLVLNSYSSGSSNSNILVALTVIDAVEIEISFKAEAVVCCTNCTR